MDFVDWRKPPEENSTNPQTSENVGRRRGKKYQDYVEELIQEASALPLDVHTSRLVFSQHT